MKLSLIRKNRNKRKTIIRNKLREIKSNLYINKRTDTHDSKR